MIGIPMQQYYLVHFPTIPELIHQNEAIEMLLETEAVNYVVLLDDNDNSIAIHHPKQIDRYDEHNDIERPQVDILNKNHYYEIASKKLLRQLTNEVQLIFDYDEEEEEAMVCVIVVAELEVADVVVVVVVVVAEVAEVAEMAKVIAVVMVFPK